MRIRQISDGLLYIGSVVVQRHRDISRGGGSPRFDEVLVYLNAGQVPQLGGRVRHYQLFYGGGIAAVYAIQMVEFGVRRGHLPISPLSVPATASTARYSGAASRGLLLFIDSNGLEIGGHYHLRVR